MVPRELDHWVRLNRGFQSDLHWWDVFLEQSNRVGMCCGVVQKPPSDTITSDVSGGGVACPSQQGESRSNSAGPWRGSKSTLRSRSYPVVVACAVWGHEWPVGSIRVLCDNTAVVAIIKAGTSIDPLVMHLMRCLFFFTARYQLILLPKHIYWVERTLPLTTFLEMLCPPFDTWSHTRR